jgi:hypothetical protein
VASAQPPLAEQFAFRFGLLGFSGHVLFSAAIGAGLVAIGRSWARGSNGARHRWRFAGGVALVVAGVVAHGLENSIGVLIRTNVGLAIDPVGVRLAEWPPATAWTSGVVGAAVASGWLAAILLGVLLVSRAHKTEDERPQFFPEPTFASPGDPAL